MKSIRRCLSSKKIVLGARRVFPRGNRRHRAGRTTQRRLVVVSRDLASPTVPHVLRRLLRQAFALSALCGLLFWPQRLLRQANAVPAVCCVLLRLRRLRLQADALHLPYSVSRL